MVAMKLEAHREEARAILLGGSYAAMVTIWISRSARDFRKADG